MMVDGVEDQEKWLAAGIAGLQQNAFYMHRALVIDCCFCPGKISSKNKIKANSLLLTLYLAFFLRNRNNT